MKIIPAYFLIHIPVDNCAVLLSSAEWDINKVVFFVSVVFKKSIKEFRLKNVIFKDDFVSWHVAYGTM